MELELAYYFYSLKDLAERYSDKLPKEFGKEFNDLMDEFKKGLDKSDE